MTSSIDFLLDRSSTALLVFTASAALSRIVRLSPAVRVAIGIAGIIVATLPSDFGAIRLRMDCVGCRTAIRTRTFTACRFRDLGSHRAAIRSIRRISLRNRHAAPRRTCALSGCNRISQLRHIRAWIQRLRAAGYPSRDPRLRDLRRYFRHGGIGRRPRRLPARTPAEASTSGTTSSIQSPGSSPSAPGSRSWPAF